MVVSQSSICYITIRILANKLSGKHISVRFDSLAGTFISGGMFGEHTSPLHQCKVIHVTLMFD